MILINFTRFICEKGVFASNLQFFRSVLIQMSLVALLARTLSLFPWSSLLYHITILSDQTICSSFLHRCTFMHTRTHTSLTSLKMQFSIFKPEIPVCNNLYPFAQWKETESKLNRTSFYRLQKKRLSKCVFICKGTPANKQNYCIWISFLIDMAVALLISTISYQQAIKSSENGLTLFKNYSERIRMACQNWMARRATRQMPCLYRCVRVCLSWRIN